MWWKKKPKATCTRKTSRSLSARLRLEPLEGRLLLNAKTWNGNADDSLYWTLGTNWLPVGVPAAGDTVTFDGAVSNQNSIVDGGAQFGGAVKTITIKANYTGTIWLARNLTVDPAAGDTSTMANGTIDRTVQAENPTLTNSAGTFVWSGGTITGTNVVLKNNASATLTMSTSTLNLDNGAAVNNAGTATVDSDGTLDVKNGSSVTNSGTFNVTGGPVTNSAGNASFTNSGTLNVSKNLTTGTFNNTGGTATINTGGTVTFTSSGSQTGTGASTIFNGGTMVTAVSPGYQVSGGSVTTSASGTSITGTITNTGATVTIGGTSTFTVSGNYSQASGTLSLTADASGANGKLAVGANFSPGGTLYVNFTGNVVVGQTWSIITYGSGGGEFSLSSNAHQYAHDPIPDVGNTYKIKLTHLLIVDGGSGTGTGEVLTDDALPPIIDEAIARWTVFMPSAGTDLANVKVVISNLPDGVLGLSLPGEVRLDDDAAGYGWFIDRTPADDSEFATTTGPGEFKATSDSPAYGAVDLLTAVLHEFGHQLGLLHSTDPQDVMASTLALSMRRVPTDTTVANAVVDDGMGSDGLHVGPAGVMPFVLPGDMFDGFGFSRMLGRQSAEVQEPFGRLPVLTGIPLFDRQASQQLVELSGGSSEGDGAAADALDDYFADIGELRHEAFALGL